MSWLDQEEPLGRKHPARAAVAPLSVAGLLRGRVFDGATTVLTSATLTIGGSFDAMARAWGLSDDPVAWSGRRLAVRARQVGHPLRRRAPAAA
jgi:ATP-dependent DNA helicase DinG